MIRAIDRRTVDRIASGQVITDLASAIKELVENSLDAAASSIEVVLYGEGLEAFEVTDNGTGIGEADLGVLGQAHCTSKLESFGDIDGLESLGFRGEAFHSLCTLSRLTTLTSRPAASEFGLVARYAGAGGALQSLRPCPASAGTKVRVEGLFHEYAVRLTDWRKNAKKVFAKALRTVQSYAVGFPGVKFRCVAEERGRHQVLLATSGSGSLVAVFSELFGVHSGHLAAVSDTALPDMTITAALGRPDGPRRSTADRQFLFVNGHPSDQRLIQKAVNEVYREHGIADYPCAAVCIRVGAGCCDVNLTPDKRTITVFQEKEIAARLAALLRESVFSSLQLTARSADSQTQATLSSLRARSSQSEMSGVPGMYGVATADASEQLADASEKLAYASEQLTGTSEELTDAPRQRTLQGHALQEHIPQQHALQQHAPQQHAPQQHAPQQHAPQQLADAPVLPSLIAAPVSDCLSKDDFLAMHVVGQFNCGFILARLERGDTCLMYIVDQHAADERFRLETLERTETPTAQRLMAPKRFSVPLEDSLFIASHLPDLQALGFWVSAVDEEGNFELTRVPQIAGLTLELKDLLDTVHRLRESAIGARSLACCERVQSTLASKACRSAVMIGAPLSLSQMTTIVRNLAGLSKPWICAHGRPTVRLLYSTRLLGNG